jgi:hypothetical protein
MRRMGAEECVSVSTDTTRLRILVESWKPFHRYGKSLMEVKVNLGRVPLLRIFQQLALSCDVNLRP